MPCFFHSPQLISNRVNFHPVTAISAIIYKEEDVIEMTAFWFANANDEVFYENYLGGIQLKDRFWP